MKVLVPLKRVLDPNTRVRIRPDGSAIDDAGLRMAINPFDEIALERAIRLREASHADEIVAVSIGSRAVEESLRYALAMGADRAILIEVASALEPLAVAKLLRRVVDSEGVTLVLMGKQAVDHDHGQTPQMLAGLLGWAQATYASDVALEGPDLRVARETDRGSEVLQVPLPAVVSADLRLNPPRFASLPNIMRARKKPLTVLSAETWDDDLAPRQELLAVAEAKTARREVMVASVDELVEHLRATTAVLETPR